MKAASLLLIVGVLSVNGGLPAAPEHQVIFDTDFGYPPQDDAMALMLALKSPEIRILGITTVAGNRSVERATSDVLRMLEVVKREDIPVFRGANMPLVHEKSEYATHHWGEWWVDDPPPAPPGGFAKKTAESRRAVDFIISTVMENPGRTVILAIGPLTNIATAIRQERGFAENVKQLVIMGGAIASLPDGGGNQTPNAEFNFWVDPEAANVVLRSGIPIILSPLNVSRKTAFTKEWYDRIVAVETPFTRLIKEVLGSFVEKNPGFVRLMYDQVATATLIDPTIMKTKELYVDVDAYHGLNYGVSVGGDSLWPGAEGSKKITVQYDLDREPFMKLYVERLSQP